ncbi:glycosyltransferase [Alkalihalobacillus sp. CinArs1]|uniref:glycosyltransferase n=1 Tax=Alkalihalobacillus sp. CinArs1 TaxID=2995314 RepID=UPI0022DE63DA|nr:glycosyltransferase [Alkalihalobacillus sp. CinArs1]
MKILIVSPFFPPFGTVAIVRVSSLAHELIKQGHELTIIRNEFDERIDKLSDSDEDLLKLETHTVNVDQSVRYFEASNRYKSVFREVMNKEKFDLVFITAGPYYTIPLCKVAKEEYNTKCVIDYRDLWIFDMRNKMEFFNPYNLSKKTAYFLIEKENIKYADLVVTVTEEWKQILKRVYKKKDLEVISNGYDDNLLKKSQGSTENPYQDKFVVAAFGKLSYYSVKHSIDFFKAMKTLNKKYPELLVLHIGLPEKETNEAIKISGFNPKNYKNTGFINYVDGIEMLKKSDACVIIDVRKGAMGTKFYDYVFVNKPLVYIGKKNTDLDNLISGFENGFSCYDENDALKAINKIKDENISSLTNDKDVGKYARSKQNIKYVEFLETL